MSNKWATEVSYDRPAFIGIGNITRPVYDFSKAVELALFYDAKLDIAAIP
jgi:hypothetical protein